MKSNREWKYWGQRDPLYGVAAWEGRERGGENPWTDSEFYRLGESDWRDFRARWSAYGLTPGDCLEIGCGAGRMTRAMAGSFERLLALDVAPDMLGYARARVDAPNVEFRLVDGSGIPGPEDAFDAVFSTHVFQHLDSRADAALYFAEISRVLRPGGSMMIHLPICAWPAGAGRILKGLYSAKKRAGDVVAALKRQAMRLGWHTHLMRLQSFEIDWLYAHLSGLGLQDLEVSFVTARSNNDPHPFVLGRKLD